MNRNSDFVANHYSKKRYLKCLKFSYTSKRMHKRSIARIFQIWWIDNDSFSCSLCFCLTISSTSSSECSLSTSVNLLYVHPLFFLPGSSIFNIACPIYPLSLLYMCPNHLRLESLMLCQPKRLMYPFLVLSIRVTANKNLQLFQLQLGLLSFVSVTYLNYAS